MDLFLVRHAKAEPRDPHRWPADAKRPLTEDGIREFSRFVRTSRLLPGNVDVLATSPLVRAKQTADILHQVRTWPPAEEWKELEPNADPALLLERLAATKEADRIALVGHMPHIGRLLSLLTTGRTDGLSHKFRKGAVARVRLESPATLPGRLDWLVPPA
jgi:phosphohistidine phosphatase